MKTLKLEIGNASRPVILDKASYPGTIMEDPISTAYSIFKRVLHEGESYLKEEAEKKRKLGFEEFERDWSFKVRNNVIPFLGDRGSGKTSCMLSVQNIILEDERARKRFLTMDVVDPSFFDEDHNILQLFVAQLYTLFVNSDKYSNLRNKNEVLDLKRDFLQLQKNLKYLDKEKSSEALEDDYDLQLETLASGVYLQSNLRRVVRKTLEFFGKEFLLITIDDLDININRAYEMMEQVRKYLIMPEVVILLSAKLDQLEAAVRLHFNQIFYGVGVTDEDEIAEMTERYLSKFLPQSHRVFMMDPEALLSAGLEIANENGNLIRKEPFDNVASGVLDLIFHKTRYLFYNRDGAYSYILPRNLRNLVMLIELLVGMENHNDNVYVTTDDTDGARQNLVNKQRFKDYLINDALNVLTPENRQMVLGFYLSNDIPRFNKLILSKLKNKYPSHLPTYYEQEHWNNILDEEAKDFNVSLGDVLEVLNHLSKVIVDDEDRYLLFAIQTIYSIRMYELYDRMTDAFNSLLREQNAEKEQKARNNEKEGEQDAKEKQDDRVELLNYSARYQEIPDFLKLLGGSMISFDRQHRILQNDRDRRLLNAQIINREIRKLVEAGRKHEKEGKYVLPDELMPQLRVLEFFALCAAFHIDTKKTEDIPQMLREYRTSPLPFFVKPFNTGLKNIVFSITKPLFSLIYPKTAYTAFGEDFWKLCLDTALSGNPSLLGQVLHRNRRYAGDAKVDLSADLASRASIRNMEILIDLYNKILDAGPNIRLDADKRGVPGVYGKFLNAVGNYKWHTYSFNENTDRHHTIKLSVLQPLADVMKSVSDSKESKDDRELFELFERCFTDGEGTADRKIPEKDSPAYNRFTPEFYYDRPAIRRIIFQHYPNYQKEYEKDKTGKFYHNLTNKGGLKDNNGEDVVKYLASITDMGHNFLAAVSEELQDDYLKLIKAMGFVPVARA